MDVADVEPYRSVPDQFQNRLKETQGSIIITFVPGDLPVETRRDGRGRQRRRVQDGAQLVWQTPFHQSFGKFQQNAAIIRICTRQHLETGDGLRKPFGGKIARQD